MVVHPLLDQWSSYYSSLKEKLFDFNSYNNNKKKKKKKKKQKRNIKFHLILRIQN